MFRCFCQKDVAKQVRFLSGSNGISVEVGGYRLLPRLQGLRERKGKTYSQSYFKLKDSKTHDGNSKTIQYKVWWWDNLKEQSSYNGDPEQLAYWFNLCHHDIAIILLYNS